MGEEQAHAARIDNDGDATMASGIEATAAGGEICEQVTGPRLVHSLVVAQRREWLQ